MFPDKDIDKVDPLMAYKAAINPDVMYLYQAMNEHNKDNYIQAMQKEVNNQASNGNFTIVRKSDVPSTKTVLKSI